MQAKGPGVKKEEKSYSGARYKVEPSVLCKIQFAKALQQSTCKKVNEIIQYGIEEYPEIVRGEDDQANFLINLSLVTTHFLIDMNERFDLGLNLSNYI